MIKIPKKFNRKKRSEKGKKIRERVPREDHNKLEIAERDPLKILKQQDEGRLKDYLPIKYGRMLVSPFAFFRGSASLMANDLAQTPTTGIHTQLCGDAHLANFGAFASPERKLVFDLNDFDETIRGPWEWDLKRLATSAVIGGKEIGLNDKAIKDIGVYVSKHYRKAMESFSNMHTLDVWYYNIEWEDVHELFIEDSSKAGIKSMKQAKEKADRKTFHNTIEKMTVKVGDIRQIKNDPPLVVRLEDLLHTEYLQNLQKESPSIDSVLGYWQQYLNSLSSDKARLMQRFQIVDVALRVGGIGSVGTMCFIVLLKGGASDDYFILQLKEAGEACMQPYLGTNIYKNQAQRVVMGQRMMNAISDIFLGWHKSRFSHRYFYWRQFKDKKSSFDITNMDEKALKTYLRVCAVCLARAHARTGDGSMIYGYMGKSNKFDKAIGAFALKYAEQNEKDYNALVNAVNSGEIKAWKGI